MKLKDYEPTTEAGIYKCLADWMKHQHPGVIWFFDLSGIRVHQGTRAQLKHMRSDRGIPDLVILAPRGGYSGLLLEIKRIGSGPYTKAGELKKDYHLQEQAEVLRRLTDEGYLATFGTGLQECKNIITTYLWGTKNDDNRI